MLPASNIPDWARPDTPIHAAPFYTEPRLRGTFSVVSNSLATFALCLGVQAAGVINLIVLGGRAFDADPASMGVRHV